MTPIGHGPRQALDQSHFGAKHQGDLWINFRLRLYLYLQLVNLAELLFFTLSLFYDLLVAIIIIIGIVFIFIFVLALVLQFFRVQLIYFGLVRPHALERPLVVWIVVVRCNYWLGVVTVTPPGQTQQAFVLVALL